MARSNCIMLDTIIYVVILGKLKNTIYYILMKICLKYSLQMQNLNNKGINTF